MIQQKPQLLPQPVTLADELGENPDDEAQHDREAGVSNDDKKPTNQQDQSRLLEGYHAIRGEGKAQVVKGRVGGEERPPRAADSRIGKDRSVLLFGHYVRHEKNDAKNLKGPKVT